MAGRRVKGMRTSQGLIVRGFAKGVQDYAWEGIHDVLSFLESAPPRLTSSITTDNCPNGEALTRRNQDVLLV